MAVKIEKQQNNLVQLDIEIDAKEAGEAYEKTVRRISGTLNIAGFRKGKAPKSVVEKYVGEERIKQETLQDMLPGIFGKVISENELDVVTEPYVDKYEFETGKPVKISAKVELRPEVILGEYKNLDIKVDKFETPKDALEKEIERLADRFSTLEIVEGRESKNTDVVNFDFEGFSNNEPIQNGASKNYVLDLGNSNFIPGFAESLVGHKAGEEFEISVKFPENYHDDKMKGADAIFKIKLNDIKERVKPEINDELAKKAGPFQSLEELKADIQKYLDENEKNENERKTDETIFKKIIEDSKVDIQETMIEREAQLLLRDMRQKYEQQGIPWDKIVESQGEDKMLETAKEDAKNRIKNSLVIEKIAKDEDIRVNDEDFKAQIAELAASYRTDVKNILAQMKNNPSVISAISQQIISKKVSEFLRSANKFELVVK